MSKMNEGGFQDHRFASGRQKVALAGPPPGIT
jgi:hypothetical protein